MQCRRNSANCTLPKPLGHQHPGQREDRHMTSSNLVRPRDLTTNTEYQDYGYHDARPPHVARLLLPPLMSLCGEVGPGIRILDVGCGNGFIAGCFAGRGAAVVGIDLSEQGIAIARAAHPATRFEVMAAD